MRRYLSKTVRGTLNRFGWDVERVHQIPKHTLLGLREHPIRSIIDVGANVGQFAKHMRTVFPEATIYCFEPLPTAYEALAAWTRGQPAGRVHAFKVAVGDSEGTVEMHHHTEFSPSSSILESTEELKERFPQTRSQAVEHVPLTTLDAALAGLDEPPRGEVLLKIDTQGYEEFVLRGAPQTLDTVRACIVEVNLDTLYDGQASFAGVYDEITRHGLEYRGNFDQVYAEDGHVMFLDAVFVRRQ